MFKHSKNIITSAVLLSLILSNFAFLPSVTYALQSGPEGSGAGIPGASSLGPIGRILGGACGILAGGFMSGLIEMGVSSLTSSTGLEGGGEVPVNDLKNNSKEQCMDKIAWRMAKYLIRQIVDDLAVWIRSGANGKPRFIQNFKDYLYEAADNAGGLLLEQILGKENAKLLCEPWRLKITFDLFDKFKRNKYSFKAQCKISEILDQDAFLADFNRGGWPAFLMTALDDGSNPMGSYLLTQHEKERREYFELEAAKLEAKTNKGALPGVCIESQKTRTKPATKTCLRSEILTPGAAIIDMLPEVFATDLKQLEIADELNEIIAATIDAIRMKRFWQDGLVGATTGFDDEGNPFAGFLGENDEFDADNWDIGEQIPVIISPKNKEIVTEPIHFDWEDVVRDLGVTNYLILITKPDGEQFQIETPTAEEEGLAPPSEYTQTEQEFMNDTDLGGMYEWRVAALDASGNIIGGEIGGFSLPSTFIIPVPNPINPKEGEVATKPIRFSWTRVPAQEVAYYKLVLAGAQNFELQTDKETLSYQMSDEEFNGMRGGEYLWKVAAFDESGKIMGRYSKSVNFKVLKAPVLVNPSEGAEISLPYTFGWSSAPLATNYDIKIIKKGIRTFSFESNSPAITLNEDDFGARPHQYKYGWQVRSILVIKDEETRHNKTYTSDWSEQNNFTIKESGDKDPMSPGGEEETIPSEGFFNLTLNVVTKEMGKAISSPDGINCGDVCVFNFEKDSEVTLNGVPNSGFKVNGWGNACGGTLANTSCVLKMNGNKVVDLLFSSNK